MKKIIYKIEVLNWDKYNGSLKKGHKRILLSTGFLSNSKIRMLTPVTRLLYLSCLLVAGESTTSQIEVSHESLVFQSGVKSQSIESQLTQLQSLQLVTFEKIVPLLNRIEKNRKEENRIEVLDRSKEVVKPNKDLNRKIWDAFKDAYFLRYKIEPLRNASVNAKISQLGKRLGYDAPEVVKFYLTHNEKFYVQKMHDIGFCLKDAESLYTQYKKGKAITSMQVTTYINEQRVNELDAAVERGGL